MKTFFITIRAITYMTGFLFLWGWVASIVRGFDRRFWPVLPQWTDIPGLVLIFAGGTLALACAATFITRGQGTPALFDPPRKFVALGPYKHVRNPMYIGGLTLLIGFGLYLHSIAMLLLSPVLFLLAHLLVVYIEEPDLKKRFGVTYEEYLAVPRWIPKW